ncbi:hypothetical protein CKA32_007107 [Geitlerinema sp. FC II]|nr:hypothetical protein CKA32_007107 [Geitlerinema sp. FC II]
MLKRLFGNAFKRTYEKIVIYRCINTVFEINLANIARRISVLK